MTNNYISTQLEISEEKVKADTHVKNVLAARPFLAWIIKATVHEVRDYSIEEIADMIEGEPHIGVEPVDPGMTNHPKITGSNTEDNVPFEGANYYDVLTYIRIPDTPFPVKIIINVEGQADTSPGYDLVTRGVYYGARRISAQKLLMTIFSENLSFEQKRDTITREFGISMTNDEESEVRTVCNYSDGIERRALKRGEEKGAKANAVNVVDNLTKKKEFILDEACDIAGISTEEYFEFKRSSRQTKT